MGVVYQLWGGFARGPPSHCSPLVGKPHTNFIPLLHPPTTTPPSAKSTQHPCDLNLDLPPYPLPMSTYQSHYNICLHLKDFYAAQIDFTTSPTTPVISTINPLYTAVFLKTRCLPISVIYKDYNSEKLTLWQNASQEGNT